MSNEFNELNQNEDAFVDNITSHLLSTLTGYERILFGTITHYIKKYNIDLNSTEFVTMDEVVKCVKSKWITSFLAETDGIDQRLDISKWGL